MTNEITIFETKDKAISIPVNVSSDTVWLSLDQMASLFQRDKSTVSRHISNVFKEGELFREAVVAKYATTAADGKTYQVDCFNLDVIISVGYRVKSQRGIEFRQWANKILKDYILQGYAVNQKRLEVLNKTIEIESRIIAHMSGIDTDEMMEAVNLYTSALDLLDDYDHQCIQKPDGNKEVIPLTVSECYEIISAMKFGSFSSLFGVEKEEGKLDAVISAVHQKVFGEDVYPTLEEKAANLLYLLVKDHPFEDGCKRIAATLFLSYLQKNGILKRSDGKQIISNGTLVALTLLIAESRPEEKAIMISVVMNILNIN